MCLPFLECHMSLHNLSSAKEVEKRALSVYGRVKFEAMARDFRAFAAMDGEVQSDKLEFIMRSNGLCPSLREIASLKRSIDDRGGSIDLQSFFDISLQCESLTSGGSMAELLNFFSVYDPSNSGLVSERVFRTLMSDCGELMSEKEVDEVVNAFKSRSADACIDYRAFITTITGT
jgi:Ca2+-binding EF-hand superfamily protein